MALTLYDFDDDDLLYAFEKAADDRGRATAEDTARELGKEELTANIGRRFSWYRSWGIMDYEAGNPGEWWLTDEAEAIRHPDKLSPAGKRALDNLDEGLRVELVGMLSKELAHSSRQAAHLGRRAYAANFRFKDPVLARRRNGGRSRKR